MRAVTTSARIAMTLADLAGAPESFGLQSPAVLIFGEVARLADPALVEDVLSHPNASRLYA